MGLTYFDTQEIVGIMGACENVDTLFKVGNRLSLPLFMTQMGKLFFRANRFNHFTVFEPLSILVVMKRRKMKDTWANFC
jgi:hypothetical protein